MFRRPLADVEGNQDDAAALQLSGRRFLSYVLSAPEASGARLYVVLNAAGEPITFTLPNIAGLGQWGLLL
jgi:isoamylase